MSLPHQLLQFISDPTGGKVVLVIGAGTSVEPPTNLPLSGDMSAEVYRRLVEDGIITNGCENPRNLSLVADIVYEIMGEQIEVVKRMNRQKLKKALPNRGHHLASALLIEGAISDILTLNYDLAICHGLADLSSGDNIALIEGPEDHIELGPKNIIFLHRSANKDPEDWILRSDLLDEEWKDEWESVITNRILSSPAIIFVGLGSPAASLTETVNKIREAIPESTNIFYVSPANPKRSGFFKQLNTDGSAAIELGWSDFMEKLSDRLLSEQKNSLLEACSKLCNEFDLSEPNYETICEEITEQGLLKVGKTRASWLLHNQNYAPSNNHNDLWLADLLLAISLIVRIGDCQIEFKQNGLIEFTSDNGEETLLYFMHGKSIFAISTIEDQISNNRTLWNRNGESPKAVLISGVEQHANQNIASPRDITGNYKPNDIIEGKNDIDIIPINDLRSNQRLVMELFNE